MQTIYSRIQKSVKLSRCNANSKKTEINVDGDETARRFCVLAAYIAESLSSRGEADAALFQRLLPNEEDVEIIKLLWEHAVAELAGAMIDSGWKTETYDNAATAAEDSGVMATVKTAAADFMARCMTADWIRIRGCRPANGDMLETELADKEQAEARLQSALATATPDRKASPRGFPPI